MSVRSSTKSPSLLTIKAEAQSLGINPHQSAEKLLAAIKAHKAAKEAAEKRPVIEKHKALSHASAWHNASMEAVKTATNDQLNNLRQVLVDWRREIDAHTGDDYTAIHAKWKEVFTNLVPKPKPAAKPPAKAKKAKDRKSKAKPVIVAEAPVVAPEPVIETPTATVVETVEEVDDPRHVALVEKMEQLYAKLHAIQDEINAVHKEVEAYIMAS